MKKLFSILAIASGLFVLQSCGTKVCDPGYEGSDCKTLNNAKFVGTYNAKGSGSNSKYGAFNISGYTQTISGATATPSIITFSNLGNFTTPAVVNATVSSTNTSTFSISNYTDATGRKFNGSGTLDSTHHITINYTIYYSTDSTTDTNTEVFK